MILGERRREDYAGESENLVFSTAVQSTKKILSR